MNDNSNLKNMKIKDDGYYNQTRPEMLKYIPDSAKKILDVGCGEGTFSKQLKEKNTREIWGIELDEKSAEIARQKLDKVFVGDVNSLIDKLPDNYFDVIIFNDILEHLVDPYQILNKIKTKLTPEAIVVSSLPNVRYLLNLVNLIFKKQWKYEDSGILDKTHLRFFTEKSIKDMFDSLHYELQTLEGINGIKSWKFKVFSFLTFGFFSDTKHLQFACVVKPKR
ncbi:MAG: class I SAM-dependent methyltransferase [Patescibacteria group bacterium]|nr:class I SAM-dependent methyltransferase [Patescibacteria group bacterium]